MVYLSSLEGVAVQNISLREVQMNNKKQCEERVVVRYVEVPRKEERSMLSTLTKAGIIGGGLALLKLALFGDPTDAIEVAAEIGDTLLG